MQILQHAILNDMKRLLILLKFSWIACLLMPVVVAAQRPASGNFISGSLPALKQLSTEMNQNVLAMLTLIRELEKYGLASQKNARVISPDAKVRETDNVNSTVISEIRMNEEPDIIEERDDWIRIRMSDGRVGWMLKEDVQVLVRQIPDAAKLINPKDQDVAILLKGIARCYRKYEEQSASASEIFTKIESNYKGLPADKKKEYESDYQSFSAYSGKIAKYAGYVDKFANPYKSIILDVDLSKPSATAPGTRFTGTVAADAGWSTYSNMNTSSAVTRRLVFTGAYQIDKNTEARLAVNHQKEQIQNVFTNTAFDAGIVRRFSEKMTLGANINYALYRDKATENNAFSMLSGGFNSAYNPSDKVNVYANVTFQSKNFKTPDNNDYQGLIYMTGVNLSPNAKNLIGFRIQGITQSGEMDYLTFNQLNPQFLYTRRPDNERLFSIGIDYDLLRFTATNNGSDYQKFKADLRWKSVRRKGGLSTRNLNLVYKQFPNNSRQDYYRMGYTIENRKGSLKDNQSSVSSFGYVINVLANREEDGVKDYLDMRWDRSRIRPGMYSNINLLTRLWNNIDVTGADTTVGPDHFVDFYFEVGPSFRSKSGGRVRLEVLRVGLLAGGHIFYNFDADLFRRNGNSLRGGICANSSIRIFRSSLMLGGSYERSLVMTSKNTFDPITGTIVYGDIVYRKPSSLQFNIDYRQPVLENWDVHFNLGNYDIRTDATAETSINPVARKSSLRITGGLMYRFAL